MVEQRDRVLLTSKMTWSGRLPGWDGIHVYQTSNCEGCEHNIPFVDDKNGSKRVERGCFREKSWRRIRARTNKTQPCRLLQRDPEVPLDQIHAAMIPISEIGLVMPEEQATKPPTQTELFINNARKESHQIPSALQD